MSAATNATIDNHYGISRRRMSVVHYLLCFLVLGSAVSFLTGFEIWPFSPYRMYATLRTSATVENDWLYGVTRDGGAEIPLWEAQYTAPTSTILSEYHDNPQDAGPALGAVLDRYEALRLAGRHDGPPLRGIRLYRVGWDLQPDAGNVANPDRRELLAEWLTEGR